MAIAKNQYLPQNLSWFFISYSAMFLGLFRRSSPLLHLMLQWPAEITDKGVILQAGGWCRKFQKRLGIIRIQQ